MGRYIRLVDFNSQQEKEKAFLVAAADSNCGYAFDCKTEDFDKIPGSPIAYWVSEKMVDLFKNKKVHDFLECKTGLICGSNEKHIRMWQEVDSKNFNVFNEKARWYAYNHGGDKRKWYGSHYEVVDFENNGFEIKKEKNSMLRNSKYYFKNGITWNRIGTGSAFASRIATEEFLFDDVSPSGFLKNVSQTKYLLGFMNSKVNDSLLKVVRNGIKTEIGHLQEMPMIIDESKKPQIDNIVEENIAISKVDWDSFETSWDFVLSPFIEYKNKTTYKSNNATSFKIEDAYFWYKLRTETDFVKLKANEEELNRLFIEIYGLQDELTPDVADKDVTVARICDTKEEIPASMKGNKYVLTRQDVVKDLISYLVGVAFGRYSLDTEGIAFAGGEFDFSQYITFKPDADGVIPIYNQVGMDNGLTAVIIKLIKVIYGEDSYRENIDFVAESLIKRSNESSEETLNRYLCDEFYADHLKKYKKRPIYWQFCSGKNSGFKCLIYMHRYNSDTLAVINSKYFLPESTRLKNEYDEFAIRIIEADNKDKVRLEKEKSKIFAAYAEALEYGQVLDHMANRYVSIDLDDGVVVNYAKFQSVELVSDSGNKIKKDLLSPIK